MRWLTLALVAFACGCTPGASGGSSGAPNGPVALTVDVNLTSGGHGSVAAGTTGGYAPLVAMVPVGSQIRFVNSDGFAHTATSLGGPVFPAASPFTSAALSPSGNTISSGFSSGILAAGSGSQMLLADKPGTYLFGCFYHYSAPMRGAIVVQ